VEYAIHVQFSALVAQAVLSPVTVKSAAVAQRRTGQFRKVD
jgi:hypothetical protein